MASEDHMLCARWIAGFALTAGFLALFFYLSYRPIPPRYFISHLSLNTTSTASSPVHHRQPLAGFALEIRNTNKHLGLFHDDLNLDFSLYSNSSSGGGAVVVAAAVVPGFYQGHHKTAFKNGTTFNSSSSSGGRKWPAGAVEVRLLSAMRYKVLAWRSKRQEMEMSGKVEVDDEGQKVAEGPVRLRSGAPRVRRTRGFACVCCVIVTLMLLR